MSIRFYADEHVSGAVIRGLRQRGLDVTTVSEADLLGASDVEHLEWAEGEGRVIFTQDTDFLRLHAAGHSHAGIAYAPQGTPVSRIIRGLLLIYEVLESHEMTGQVEFV